MHVNKSVNQLLIGGNLGLADNQCVFNVRMNVHADTNDRLTCDRYNNKTN